MKKVLILLLAVIMVLSAFLTSCNNNPDEKGTEESTTAELIETVTSTVKADCFQMIDNFFENTKKAEKLVVTEKRDDKVIWTQTVEGGKVSVVFGEGESVAYGYIDGYRYISAVLDKGEVAIYKTDLETYNAYLYYYLFSFNYLRSMSEEDVSWSCIETKNGNKSELVFECTDKGGGIKFVVNSSDGLVTDISFTSTKTGLESVTIMTFEYGNASVTIPEINNGDEIVEEFSEEYDDLTAQIYFYDFTISPIFTSLASEIITATVSNTDGVYMIETVDGQKDHVHYTWDQDVYMFKVGDDCYYANRDGDIKYYLVDFNEYSNHFASFVTDLNVFTDVGPVKSTKMTIKGTKTTRNGEETVDAQLVLTFVYEDSTVVIVVDKVNNKLTSFTNTCTDGTGIYTANMTFTYGGASVEIPDISDWFNGSAPKEPSVWYVSGKINGKESDNLPMYYDYTSGCFKSEYVNLIMGDKIVIKNKEDAGVTYTQDIDEDYLTGTYMIVLDVKEGTITLEFSEED